MDNLAHTLVGAALGRAVVSRKVPAAALLGAIAGNAPDATEFLVHPSAWTRGTEFLVFHRGITHSFAGAIVQIVAITALAGLVVLWRRRRGGGGEPIPWAGIALCVTVAVASHLYLDWQGSYGLRPFLPWSARWYYGDWIAIVDPFFWIVPLIALAWGARREWKAGLAALVTLVAIVAVVFWPRGMPVAIWLRVAVAACAAIGVVGWARSWFDVAGRRRVAVYAVLVLALYAAANGVASVAAKADAHAAATHRFGADAQSAVLTVVGQPFSWAPMLASADSVAGPDWAVARHLDDPAVRAALTTSDGRAIAQFARFLTATVDSGGTARRVVLWDARYHGPGPGGGGWAAAEVLVP